MSSLQRETLQGWVPPLADEQELCKALESAFDYRGDVTLTLKSGETVVGYIFDRRTGRTLVDSYVRLLRRKIDRPFGTQSIQTVRGAGYRLRENGGEP